MISKSEEIIIYHNAIKLYRESMQTIMVMEECSELQQALINLRRKEKSNVEEEVADVEIMLSQLCIIHNIDVFKEIESNPVEVDIPRLSDETIKSLAELIQAITKGIRGKEVDLKTKAYKAWAYIQFLKSIIGPVKVEEFKQAKLKRLKGMVCV